MKQWYVVSYDISNDKKRRRIEKLCSKYMQRVQYSLFEGYLTTSSRLRFYHEMVAETQKDELFTANDSIFMYRQCAACYYDKDIIGRNLLNGENYLVL